MPGELFAKTVTESVDVRRVPVVLHDARRDRHACEQRRRAEGWRTAVSGRGLGGVVGESAGGNGRREEEVDPLRVRADLQLPLGRAQWVEHLPEDVLDELVEAIVHGGELLTPGMGKGG